MPAKIQISVDGVDQFNRTFSRLDENFDDLTFLWDDVRDAFWEIQEDQFQSGGAKGASGAWKPLSKKYEEEKIRRYGSFALIAGVLRATDDLYKSLTRQTKDTVYQKSKKSMAVGTSLKYAGYHQRGGGRLPKREVISISDKQKKTLQKTIQKNLVKNLRKDGVYVQTTTAME